ncbi:MAG: hypothetical protein L6R36_003654 [Xanthoria steineri]|nr:MAG: hypothetical protein L6R36_003654 [Xanthoria steineri]
MPRRSSSIPPPSLWNPLQLDELVLDILLTTLPFHGRHRPEQELFTTRNVLCGLRLDTDDASNWYRLKDLDATLNNIKSLPQPSKYYARWVSLQGRSARKVVAKSWIRNKKAQVEGQKQGRLNRIDAVTTEEDLKNVDLFPEGSLHLLCAGMHAQMMLPDLEVLLTKWHTTAKHRSDNLKPFTTVNIPRIFNYLRVNGWAEYDHWVPLSPNCRLQPEVVEAEKADRLRHLEDVKSRAKSDLGWEPRFPEAPFTM